MTSPVHATPTRSARLPKKAAGGHRLGSIQTLVSGLAKTHRTPSNEDWYLANSEADAGQTYVLDATSPATGREQRVAVTATWMRHYRAAQLSPASRASIFACVGHLNAPPVAMHAVAYPLQPLGGWIANVNSKVSMTWRPDPESGLPILLTLTAVE